MKDAQKHGISQEKIDAVSMDVYQDAMCLDEQEKWALQYAHAVTINQKERYEELHKQLEQTFTSQQIVDLTLVISITNCFNKLTGSLKYATLNA